MDYNLDSDIKTNGKVFCKILNQDGTFSEFAVKNKVLQLGRTALAKSLANQIGNGGNYQFFISRMEFGVNGTSGGQPKFVEDSATALFGGTALSKPVVASLNPDTPWLLTLTSTIQFSEIVGSTINELGLKMQSGDFFSMTTFPDINKTGSMSLVFNYRISFI